MYHKKPTLWQIAHVFHTRITSLSSLIPAFHRCWRLIWPHTHTQRHTLVCSHVTHTHSLTHHTTITEALRLRLEMLPAGNHWVSPLSFLCSLSFFLSFPFFPFFLSVFAVIAILRPAWVHLSLTLSSVTVKWTVLSRMERLFKLFSQYATHTPFSPLLFLLLSVLCMWTEAERQQMWWILIGSFSLPVGPPTTGVL